MANSLMNMIRLARTGIVLAQHGTQFFPQGTLTPWPVRAAGWLTAPLRAIARARWPERDAHGQSRLAASLARLGPSYIKLGQFLAARPDLVGAELAGDLATLRDRLPPFDMAVAKRTIHTELGIETDKLYAEFSAPVAAASIAQVHKATIADSAIGRTVAVKILRPGIEARFANDLSSFYFAARWIEKLIPAARRLKPVAVIDTLAASIALELDLRMEAAAVSEMRRNTADDPHFRLPDVDWSRTAKRVLTLEWIDAIPIGDVAAVRAAGHDLTHLANELIRTFLRHAMRDGFFHADMHQGNLFVEKTGDIVAIDFGIMGRLTGKEQRFLAEILYGFLSKDYRRAAEVHFWAGYVPETHSVEVFAQALRAIGEPIMDRPAEEISMGHLLGQLFEYTEVFDMETRPELVLLQKTMVVVEGVARTLDPRVNMWTAAEPVVKEWMESQLGAAGMLRDARDGAETVGKFVGEIPRLLMRAERTAERFSDMARDGIRLDDATVQRMVSEQSRRDRWLRAGVWIGALALAALAIAQFI